jgi:hypothetical protein
MDSHWATGTPCPRRQWESGASATAAAQSLMSQYPNSSSQQLQKFHSLFPHLLLHLLTSLYTLCLPRRLSVPRALPCLSATKPLPSATVAVDSCRFLVRPALPGRRKRGSNVTRDHPPSGFHAILARKVKIPTALPLPPASSPPRALLDPVVDSVLH